MLVAECGSSVCSEEAAQSQLKCRNPECLPGRGMAGYLTAPSISWKPRMTPVPFSPCPLCCCSAALQDVRVLRAPLAAPHPSRGSGNLCMHPSQFSAFVKIPQVVLGIFQLKARAEGRNPEHGSSPEPLFTRVKYVNSSFSPNTGLFALAALPVFIKASYVDDNCNN